MQYTKIELYQYIPFMFANIRRLELDTESATQIIIGANGSGKSSLLREITPLPATRTDYENGGYKRLIIQHDGSEYILTSDFTNKSSPHSFTKDGDELNEGGTTVVQEDLVRKHLGYTKMIEDLTTGKHLFCSMPAGIRKNLLMEVSPFNLGFILDRHRAVSSAIRACKNNLALLQERKASLESEMMSDEAIAGLTLEQENLSNELTKIVEFIHRIDAILEKQMLENEVGADPYTAMPYSDLIRTISVQSPNWKNVSRDDPDGQQMELHDQVQKTIGIVPVIEEQIAVLTDDINQYQTKLEDLAGKSHSGKVRQEIEGIKLEIIKLDGSTTEAPFPEYTMDSMPDLLREIQDIVTIFLGCQIQLIGSQAIARKTTHLQRRQQQHAFLSEERTILQAQRQRLLDQKGIQLTDLPATNCSKMVCPLYASFVEQANQSRQEAEHLGIRLNELDRRLNRLSMFIDATQVQLEEMRVYIPYLSKLVGLIREHPYLKLGGLDSSDILRKLRAAPARISVELEEHYQASKATYLLAKLQSQLEEKLATLSRLQETDLGELTLIEEIVRNKEQSLEVLRDRLSHLNEQQRVLETQLLQISEYRNAQDKLNSAECELANTLKAETLKYETQVLGDLRATLDAARTSHIGRMGAIDHAFRTQEILRGRYNEEVMHQISRIEKDREELTLLELALSPSRGIPHKYTVKFLNALIETMNVYMDVVFTYPFELHLLDEDAALDYKFPVQVGDVVVPDIGLCSDAQKEMINLAFSLALIKQLGLSQYPIFLDETGRAFDHRHRQSLLNLLHLIIEDGTISTLFLVNHTETILGGIPNADILVLSELNVLLPSQYNYHAKITKG